MFHHLRWPRIRQKVYIVVRCAFSKGMVNTPSTTIHLAHRPRLRPQMNSIIRASWQATKLTSSVLVCLCIVVVVVADVCSMCTAMTYDTKMQQSIWCPSAGASAPTYHASIVRWAMYKVYTDFRFVDRRRFVRTTPSIKPPQNQPRDGVKNEKFLKLGCLFFCSYTTTTYTTDYCKYAPHPPCVCVCLFIPSIELRCGQSLLGCC